MSSINKRNQLVVLTLMALFLMIGATSIAFAESPKAVPSCESEQGRLSGRPAGKPAMLRLTGSDAGVRVNFAQLTVDEIAALFGVTEYKSINAQGQTSYTQVGSDLFTSLPVTSTAGEPVGDIKVGFHYVALGNGRVTTQFGYLPKPVEEDGTDVAHLAQCEGPRASAGARGSQGADRSAGRQQHSEEREQARQERASSNASASAQGNVDGERGRSGSQRSRGNQADTGGGQGGGGSQGGGNKKQR